jgi:hypothetical protein
MMKNRFLFKTRTQLFRMLIQYVHRLLHEPSFLAYRIKPYYWQTEYFFVKRTFSLFGTVRYAQSSVREKVDARTVSTF